MDFGAHYLLERKAVQAASEQDGNPFFCQHLSTLNKTQKVVASEDICNRQGAVVLKKGEDFTERRAQIIVQHKLIKPIEQCIQLSETFDAAQLHQHLKKFARTVPGLQSVAGAEPFDQNLRKMCKYYGQFPLIKQNLTVLANRLPDIYRNALFTAIAGLAIALQMQRSEREQQIIFMAALTHDCGFLYIPHELATQKTDFSADQWHSLLAHPIIAKRFLDSVPHLPKEVGQAVLDHHERTDGTGYPHQRFGDELTIASQIIGITDDIVDGFRQYAAFGEHTHRMILVALKLNDHLHFEQVFKATAVLFGRTPKPTTPVPALNSARQLLDRHQSLVSYFESIRTLARKLIAQTKHPLNRSIASMLGRLAISIVRAGIMQDEHVDWLTELAGKNTHEETEQLTETAVMYDQVDVQLNHLKNLLHRVIEDIPEEQQTIKEDAQATFSQFPVSKTPALAMTP
ncbi:HD-GYP domain-containing protein [Simiduia agarivorans]|uniref:HD-GYP domain-containing protein n=1 Tax=Simiduia agarivorans (strain DSM 21679 / JCM 13881 / BCRC 17597 / SA1) TaxID=1117647 RepID=K4KHH0_SIMAS|nr:HD domain-containing phosphohydrolase [Simiduia agarivorans]AFU97403.1 hypothetical protein M5M_00840 [Simiduia agarivorans SA1 = DSM 21679]